MLQGDLDALVVHLLEVGLKLLATLGAAREELDDMGNRRAGRTIERLDLRRRPHVDEAVEIVVDDVVVQGTNGDAARGLVANTQHFRAIALRGNVLVAPAPILELDAPGGCTLTVEPHALRLG